MKEKLTTKEMAEKVGLTCGSINQLTISGEIVAEKIGRDYFIDPKYVQIINSRPEKRGRPRKTKNTLQAA